MGNNSILGGLASITNVGEKVCVKVLYLPYGLAVDSER